MVNISQVLRFGAVGVFNTVLDVGLYITLRHAGLDILPANIISTSAALCMSYLLNFRYTFRSTHSGSRLVWFFAITCFGLWVLQPLVITLVIAIDSYIPVLTAIQDVTGNRSVAFNAVPKLAATAVTLIWNYTWYSYKIFTSDAHRAKSAPIDSHIDTSK